MIDPSSNYCDSFGAERFGPPPKRPNEKKAALCSAAKFREETSKKQRAKARCGAQYMSLDPTGQALFCSAAISSPPSYFVRSDA